MHGNLLMKVHKYVITNSKVLVQSLQFLIVFFTVNDDEEGWLVKGKCYRSQRKNESPHDLKVNKHTFFFINIKIMLLKLLEILHNI